jgi:hypothetical protein
VAFEERNGRKHEMLEGHELPAGCLHLWADFLELHSARSNNGMAPGRISFADIDAWERVAGVLLEPWEIEAIRRADSKVMAQ